MSEASLVAELLGRGVKAAQVAAASALARPEKWRRLHLYREDSFLFLWGEITPSSGGAAVYRVACAMEEPAFSCTCPAMRKPCKHGLAILLAYARAPTAFTPTEAADAPTWLTEWTAARARRTRRTDAPAVAIADPGAQARRAADREARIAAGLDELERWLGDLARQGLAGADAKPYAFWDGPAARLVDAQAPGLARRVRALYGVVGGVVAHGEASWPERLLERLGLLHLLVAAYRRAADLPENLRAEVRHLVGWTVAQDELLARAPVVTDRWRVVGWRIEEDERLRSQRVWLLGETTGAFALILGFSPVAAPLDRSLYPGTTVDADLVFYPGIGPGARAHRALVKARRDTQSGVTGIGGVDLLRASADYAAGLAHNPWLEDAPLVLGDVTPVRGGHGEDGWLLRDAAGRVVPLSRRFGRDHTLALVALAGGRPALVFGEWNGRSVLPLGVGTEERYVPLDA
jgi:SWIM zinc finger